MCAPFTRFFAIALSAWIAFVACLLGCGQMAASLRHARPVSDSPRNSAGSADLMAGMPDCPDHSDQLPVPAKTPDRDSHSTFSCCPLETSLAVKNRSITPPSLVAVAAAGSLAAVHAIHRAVRFFAPPAGTYHSGRATLLQTGMLRI
jgi:hypothetical protein